MKNPSRIFPTLLTAIALLAATLASPSGAQEPERPEQVSQPEDTKRPAASNKPASVDRDLGQASIVTEIVLDQERLNTPEEPLQAHQVDFDLTDLSRIPVTDKTSFKLALPGTGDLVAVFDKEPDPFEGAPWPAQRYAEPAQTQDVIVRIASQAWIDELPVAVALILPQTKEGKPELRISAADTIISLGVCPEGSGVKGSCLVSYRSEVVEPGGGDDSPREVKVDDVKDADPFIGIEVDDSAPKDAARSINPISGVDPQIDVLIVRVDGASTADVALELANATAGQNLQGLNFSFEVVGTLDMAWPSGAQTDPEVIFDWIENSNAVAVQRDNVAADLVLVVVKTKLARAGSTRILYGIATSVPLFINSTTKNSEFTAIVRSTVNAGTDRDAGDLTVPHELGHLVTLRHDWCSDDDYAYRHGYVMPSQGAVQLRTIMATGDGSRNLNCIGDSARQGRVPRWSTRDGDTYSEGIPYSPWQHDVALGILDARLDMAGNQETDNERRLEFEAWDAARYRVGDVCPFGDNGFASGGLASSPARLVDQQYHDILGRYPDSFGLHYWEAQIVNGELNGDDVIINFVRSPEFEGTYAEVIRMYQIAQNRIADVGGLEYWAKTVTSREALALALMNSGSPINWNAMSNTTFVATLHQQSFGTPGAPSWWIARLNNGSWTRARMMAEFASWGVSANNWQNTVDASMLYYGMLDRAPDQGGLNYWIDQLNGGATFTGAISGFRYGLEYKNRIPGSISC